MNNVARVIKVGMADLQVAKAPDRLVTVGLGSCVAVCIYDPTAKVAGLAHVMLPSSELARGEAVNVGKYADTAIPALLARMEAWGGHRRRFVAKLAGGAQMFAIAAAGNPALRIGERNVLACKALLAEHGIPVVAEDTGGSSGRTVEFDSETGKLVIRTVQKGIKEV
ncbi:MAG: chemotaxis protein CheD [Calditerricola sp.]|nr:chemotaxis protein CheD [Calditerricola sp.]